MNSMKSISAINPFAWRFWRIHVTGSHREAISIFSTHKSNPCIENWGQRYTSSWCMYFSYCCWQMAHFRIRWRWKVKNQNACLILQYVKLRLASVSQQIWAIPLNWKFRVALKIFMDLTNTAKLSWRRIEAVICLKGPVYSDTFIVYL